MTKGAGNEAVAFAMADLTVSGDQAPTRVRLLPFGKITFRDGRAPVVLQDKAHAAAVIAATKAYAGNQDLPFDYDHQSVFGAVEGVGGTAPAAGWMKDIVLEDDGIYAEVEWTRRAAGLITDKEYRYTSPFFGFDKATGRVTRIFNSSLTNTPAIDGLDKLAASLNHPKESDMDLTALALSLGLPATATLDEITAASNARNERLTAATVGLGLTADASREVIIAASAKLKKAPADGEIVVTAAVFNDMQQQLNALNESRVTAAVDAALKAGKFTPAQKPSMLDWARKDFGAFENFIAASTTVVAGATELTGKPSGAKAVLTAEEKAAAASAGLTDEEFLAAKAEVTGEE